MKSPAPLLVIALMVFAPVIGAAETEQHDAHHPATAPAATALPAADTEQARMAMQMNHMQDMHEKFMAAKTPTERRALMAEHMKAMQDGMAMMNQSDSETRPAMGCDMNNDHQRMEQRMQMMTMMMSMIVDRLPLNPMQ